MEHEWFHQQFLVSSNISEHSVDQNFSPPFIDFTNSSLNGYNYNNTINKNTSDIEKNITHVELECSLTKVTETTHSFDRVSYKMIKKFCFECKNHLLELNSHIFGTGTNKLIGKLRL